MIIFVTILGGYFMKKVTAFFMNMVMTINLDMIFAC